MQQAEQSQHGGGNYGGGGGFHQFLVDGNHGIFAALHNGNQGHFLHQIVQQQQGGGNGGVFSNDNNDGSVEETQQQQQQQQGLQGDDVEKGEGGGGCGASSTSGNNRWPREETIALLRIRSAMETTFKDQNTKGPLWENVSRKLGELGYRRSAKKCKEKFENINKYYKKTKDGKKSYRFCTELEALFGESKKNIVSYNTPPPPNNNVSTSEDTQKIPLDVSENHAPKKRKSMSSVSGFFQDLVNQVIAHQEEMHRRFLEAIEKRDQERLKREEAWRRQEMALLAQETEQRAQQHDLASSRKATIVALLEKIADKGYGIDNLLQASKDDLSTKKNVNFTQDGEKNLHYHAGDSEKNLHYQAQYIEKWTESEIKALVDLKNGIDERQKDDVWEEVSSRMNSLGFKRSANSCREKWESIKEKNVATKGKCVAYDKNSHDPEMRQREVSIPTNEVESSSARNINGNNAMLNSLFKEIQCSEQAMKRMRLMSPPNHEEGFRVSDKNVGTNIKEMLVSLQNNQRQHYSSSMCENAEASHNVISEANPLSLMTLVQKLVANSASDYVGESVN